MRKRYVQALYLSAGFGNSTGKMMLCVPRSGWLCGGKGFVGWVGRLNADRRTKKDMR